MLELKTILVATDFSEPSIEAAKTARRLAELSGATLHVAHVVEQIAGYHNIRVHPDTELPPMLRVFVDSARNELNAFIAQHLPEIPEERRHLRVGRPYEELSHAAHDCDAGLIVVGLSARTGMSRIVLGSVAEKIIATASVPVLSLHHAPNLERGCRLLVATDLSPASKRAARLADGLASALDGSVDLMAVLEPPNRFAFWRMEPAEDVALAESRLRQRLDEFSQECLKGHSPKRVVVRVGQAADEIVATVRELDADLLFMGIVGHSSISDWLVGGVTERVLQTAGIPILTTRPDVTGRDQAAGASSNPDVPPTSK